MAYIVSFTRQAFKELEKIPEPFYSKIKLALYYLKDNPRPIGYIKLKGREGYRIRIGDYRVIYNIFDKELVVDVIRIGNRGSIYE